MDRVRPRGGRDSAWQTDDDDDDDDDDEHAVV